MHRTLLLSVLAVSVFCSYGAVQVQIPEAAELQDDLQAQIKELQRNVSDIWTYIYELRSAVTYHLTHLRQHQVDLEGSMHKMEHLHENELQMSHSTEQHSHSGEHSHADGRGSEHHSHSGEHHSHSGEHHSHSGEHHSHSGEHDHSYSYSHSHTTHDHSKEDGSHSHSHGGSDHDPHHHHDDDHHHHHDHDHKDSHESEDTQQQIQQVAEPIVEPVVVSETRQEHYHHHRHDTSSNLNLMNEHGFHHHHHHHHHDSDSRNRSRTVEIPKYSEYDHYDFAVCNVRPNRAIPEDQQQEVTGQVILWQKKTGGLLNIHVRLQGFNVGDHHGHHDVQQSIQREEDNETPLEVGHRHGFHVHASGDLSNGCQSAGPHYNPKGVNHGGSFVRHVGDLGNIECDNHGYTNILFSDDLASLQGQYSILGRAIVIHAKEDDLGKGGDAESLRTGNAGTRLACCVIQKIDKLPIQSHKAMKLATQYQNH